MMSASVDLLYILCGEACRYAGFSVASGRRYFEDGE
jgi:hypothetical protein